jgi:hypothetical protein
LADIIVEDPQEPEPAPKPVVEEPRDEYTDLFDIPSFEDFRHVFDTYPYVREERRAEGRLLLIGYASGRNVSEELIRRNCAVSQVKKVGDAFEREERSFNALSSIVGNLNKKDDKIHLFVKAIKYVPGTGVRFWTNTPKGDLENMRRYIFLTEEGLVSYPTRASYDLALLTSKGSVVERTSASNALQSAPGGP